MPNQRAEGVRMRCVPLHDDLWAAAKARAARDQTNVSAVIRAALEEYTNDDPPSER